MNTEELLQTLTSQVQPVQPDDTMAEAGRKALLPEFLKVLKHEAGSRTGADIEDVHDMRVATRRIRSTLRLLDPYYKPKAIEPFNRQLRKTARALGVVRDLDVMINNLQKFAASLPAEHAVALQPVLARLDEERTAARADLNKALDKKSYRRFLKDFGAFLTKPGAGAQAIDPDAVQPVQVRHVLPTLIYEHLGSVRAYDAVLEGAKPETLHALRIEFKRLRYAVTLFSDVMGSSIKNYVTEIKKMQDHLGVLNDATVAQERLTELINRLDPQTDAAAIEVLRTYVTQTDAELHERIAKVPDVWKRFNAQTVQKHLASAIAAL